MKKIVIYSALLISLLLSGCVQQLPSHLHSLTVDNSSASSGLQLPTEKVYDDSLTVDGSKLTSFDKSISGYGHHDAPEHGKGLNFPSNAINYDIDATPINPKDDSIALSTIYKLIKDDQASALLNATISVDSKIGQNIKFYEKKQFNGKPVYTANTIFIHSKKLNHMTVSTLIMPSQNTSESEYRTVLDTALNNFIESLNLN